MKYNKRNNKGELIDENGLTIGKKIMGSKYVRGFCAGCNEPIRISSKDALTPIYCEQCNPTKLKTRRYICQLDHLKDYDIPDIDSGFDD